MSINKRSSYERAKARRYLYDLVQIQMRRCFWCARWIIHSRELECRTIIRENQREVAWVESGETLTAGRATTDHIKPLSKGGRSNLANLVAACWECNNDRGLMNALDPSTQRQLDIKRARDLRYIRQRQRIEARRQLRPCKHPTFESQTDAFLYADKLIRLGVHVIWKTCPRCGKYRVLFGENLSGKQYRALQRKLQILNADPDNEALAQYEMIG